MSTLERLNTGEITSQNATSTSPCPLLGTTVHARPPSALFTTACPDGSSHLEYVAHETQSRKRDISSLDDSDAQEDTRSRASQQADAAHQEESPVNSTSRRHSSNISVESNYCLCPPEPKIPRPPNCFMLFRKYHKDKIRAGAPEISSVLGETWNNLSEEEQRPWKEAAEAEKKLHAQRYPNYRYQPNRKGRRSSLVESPSDISSSSWCPKCGKPTMTSPITPSFTSHPPKPILPPPRLSNSLPHAHNLPPMSGLSLVSPAQRRHSIRPQPTSIHIPPHPEHESDRGSPDAKRRRTVYGPVATSSHPPSTAIPFPTASPYRQSFSRLSESRQYASPSTSQFRSESVSHPHPPPTATQPPQGGVRLPPLNAPHSAQNGSPGPGRDDSIVKTYSFLNALRGLSRIAPPLRTPPSGAPPHRTRGALIAIEGDDYKAIVDTVSWLDRFLTTAHEAHVRVAPGPKLPPASGTTSPSRSSTSTPSSASPVPSTQDYWNLVSEWRTKSKEIETFITTPIFKHPHQNDEEIGPDERPELLVPVCLLERYMLGAADAWAAAIPCSDSKNDSGDNYSRSEHWSWCATLWRGVIGPDVVVLIKDVPEASGKGIEVLEDLKVVLIKKARSENIDEKVLRRLGFEVGEILRSCVEGAAGKRE